MLKLLIFLTALAAVTMRYAEAAQSCPGPKFLGYITNASGEPVDYCDSLNRASDTSFFYIDIVFDIYPYTTDSPEAQTALRKWTDSLYLNYYFRDGIQPEPIPVERMPPPPADHQLYSRTVMLYASKTTILLVVDEDFVKLVYFTDPVVLPIKPKRSLSTPKIKTEKRVDANGKILHPRDAQFRLPISSYRLGPVLN